jgi:hypothetical protein
VSTTQVWKAEPPQKKHFNVISNLFEIGSTLWDEVLAEYLRGEVLETSNL